MYNDKILSQDEIKESIKDIIKRDDYYKISKVVLFGSYARGEAESNSDIDLIVYDSPLFKGMKIYSFIGDLKAKLHKDIDLFVDRNIVKNSKFYENIVNDGVIIYE